MSGKLHQSNTVSINCEQFSWTWLLRTRYFDWLPHFKNCSFIVYPIKCLWMTENQHTISFHINVSYYLLLFSLYFCGIDDILYRYSFYACIFQWIYYQLNLPKNSLILPTITNKPIRTKLHQNNSHFISAASTEHPSDNGSQPIVVSKIWIQL